MAGISHNSARVAKNTLLLYLRMLLMMVIGLFTSRVVLQQLGVQDFGTYSVVYEMVMLFTIVSNSVSNAVSRFMAYEMGRGDLRRQKAVFSSAMIIQMGMSALLLVIVLSAGLWYVRNRMVIPEARVDAATWVMLCSCAMMIVQLLSIPFNATIIAAEQMKAFAYISILEAALKLGAALALMLYPADKLIFYALLMFGVSLLVRSTYAAYCHRHLPITRGLWVIDGGTIKEMLSFSGWGVLGNGVNVLNTKGISLLSNSYFGVGINAARAVALQVENIVKQFVSNFLTALNPQITKSWSSSDREYCFHLVNKGCKFSILMMLLLVIPFIFEADAILDLWLADVPPFAASFTRLTLLCLMMDMMANSLFQLVLSTGKVKAYYIATSSVSALVLAGSWLAFAMGFAPESSYWIFIGVYIIVDILKLYYAHRTSGMPYGMFFKEVVLGCGIVAVSSAAICMLICQLMPEGWQRLLVILFAATACTCAVSYFAALTRGEREFINNHISKLLHR